MPPNSAIYLVVVGQETCFPAPDCRAFSEITDGTSNSLMVTEVSPDDAVPWMAPRDIDSDYFMNIGPNTKHSHVGGFQSLLADGSVRFLSDTTAPETLRALLTVAGGETIGEY